MYVVVGGYLEGWFGVDVVVVFVCVVGFVFDCFVGFEWCVLVGLLCWLGWCGFWCFCWYVGFVFCVVLLCVVLVFVGLGIVVVGVCVVGMVG